LADEGGGDVVVVVGGGSGAVVVVTDGAVVGVVVGVVVVGVVVDSLLPDLSATFVLEQPATRTATKRAPVTGAAIFLMSKYPLSARGIG
jgi:hypothetical protein